MTLPAYVTAVALMQLVGVAVSIWILRGECNE